MGKIYGYARVSTKNQRLDRQRREIRRGRGVFGLAFRALCGAGIFLPFRRGFSLTALLAAERARRGLRLAGHGLARIPVGGIVALADDLRLGLIFVIFGIPRFLRLFVREGDVILVVTDDGYRLSLFAAFASVQFIYGSDAVGSGTFCPFASNASRIHGLALNFSFVCDSSSTPMRTLETRNPPGVKCQRPLSHTAQPFS